MGKLNTVTNGKGSKDRVSDHKKFAENYDKINWEKNKSKKHIKNIRGYDSDGNPIFEYYDN